MCAAILTVEQEAKVMHQLFHEMILTDEIEGVLGDHKLLDLGQTNL